MKVSKLLIAILLCTAGVAVAEEHPACNDLNYPYQNQSSQELRRIAESCSSKAAAKLYYNRAYHADLIVEGRTLSGLIAYSATNGETRFEAYRLYMAMLEQMAPIWFPDAARRVSFLNSEYDRRGEIARLRLRGYDHLADRLEREAVTR